MSNRIQLRRSNTPSSVPSLAQLLEGELSINLADKDLYYSNGSEVVQLNAAVNIRTDASHRFVGDNQITAWDAIASTTALGRMQVGTNLQVDVNGVVSLQNADATHTGALTAADWNTFNSKQGALGYTPVDKAGDTMLGTLVLSGDPTNANDAVNKNYVDTGFNTKLNISGGSMTGLLVLSGDPTASLGAATKSYVDTQVAVVSGTYAAAVADLAELSAILPGNRLDRQLRLVENQGAIFRYDVEANDTADGVQVIMPDDNPPMGRWFKVQAATQMHNQLAGLQGGAANDYLHLTTAEKNSYDSHLLNEDIHMSLAQGTWLDSINASATEINYLIGVTGAIQTQLDGKQGSLGYTPVNKAGDTMTGLLVLSGDPVAQLGAVTRQFLENYVIDGGNY